MKCNTMSGKLVTLKNSIYNFHIIFFYKYMILRRMSAPYFGN